MSKRFLLEKASLRTEKLMLQTERFADELTLPGNTLGLFLEANGVHPLLWLIMTVFVLEDGQDDLRWGVTGRK